MIRLGTFFKSGQYVSVLAVPSPGRGKSTCYQLNVDAVVGVGEIGGRPPRPHPHWRVAPQTWPHGTVPVADDCSYDSCMYKYCWKSENVRLISLSLPKPPLYAFNISRCPSTRSSSGCMPSSVAIAMALSWSSVALARSPGASRSMSSSA